MCLLIYSYLSEYDIVILTTILFTSLNDFKNNKSLSFLNKKNNLKTATKINK